MMLRRFSTPMNLGLIRHTMTKMRTPVNRIPNSLNLSRRKPPLPFRTPSPLPILPPAFVEAVAACMMPASLTSAFSNRPVILPSFMTMTLSLNAMISGSSEEIMMIAFPLRASWLMMRYTSSFAPTSMPRVGSSRMKISGPVRSHFARTTFCWLPPDSSLTVCCTLRILTSKRVQFSTAISLSRAKLIHPLRAIMPGEE